MPWNCYSLCFWARITGLQTPQIVTLTAQIWKLHEQFCNFWILFSLYLLDCLCNKTWDHLRTAKPNTRNTRNTRPNCLVKIIFIFLKKKTKKKLMDRNISNEELVVRYYTYNLNMPEAQSRELLQGGCQLPILWFWV